MTTLTTTAQLAAAGWLEASAALDDVAARYAIAVTPAMQAAIKTTGRDGAIARQFVPTADELVVTPEESSDPIGDAAHSPVPGIVHRCPDRVLLMPTYACAVYCRFCFRRDVVGPTGGTLPAEDIDGALDYIARTPAVWEVILTGGDPLVLSPRRLGEIMTRLDQIPHVQVIRFHTRVPVVAPERIDDALMAVLTSTTKAVYVAIHCNHVAELTEAARAACARLNAAGIPLLSQSVLLKGVNDSVDALETLMRAFVAMRIKPYYLHHLDLAPGTSHFRVPLEEGQALVRTLRGRLSGLAQPTYMLDIPGGAGKVPVSPSWIQPGTDGAVTVSDLQGGTHLYPPRAE